MRTSGRSAWCFGRPIVALVAAVVLIVAGVLAYRFVGTGFLPEMDEGAFVLDYWSPGGTALAETDRQLHIIEAILAATPEVAGDIAAHRCRARPLCDAFQNRGDMVVRLKPASERDRSSDEVIDDVRDKIVAAVPRMHVEFVQILSDVINDLAGAARPVEIRLFGPDMTALEAYGQKLAAPLAKVEGIEDLYNGVSEPTAELSMTIDAAKTNRAGLTPEQLSAQVTGALMGSDAGAIRLDDRAIDVRVRAPDSVRFSAQQLSVLPVISGQGGSPAPLGTFASFTPVDTRAELLRENQQQMIELTSDIGDRSLGAVMKDVKEVLAANPPPAGIRLELGGQYATQQAAFRALLMVLALAALSVVTVMVVQFRSFVEPLVVLLAAPLSFVGALVLLLVTKTVLNVSSFMGLILLVGLIVKNGIILLDFTHHRMRQEGLALELALREAGRIRLRPILMTTLCTPVSASPCRSRSASARGPSCSVRWPSP